MAKLCPMILKCVLSPYPCCIICMSHVVLGSLLFFMICPQNEKNKTLAMFEYENIHTKWTYKTQQASTTS